MGTDIHYFAEKRVGDHWEPAFDSYYDDPDEPEDRELWHGDQFYFGAERNYELFQILAGVVEPETGLTSRGFLPISEPRGLPDDLSAAVRAIATKASDPDDGYFGHSWLLLKELIEFPWKGKFRTFIGFVNTDNYSSFKAERPFRMQQVSPKVLYNCADLKSYPRPEWEVVSNEEMERRIEQGAVSENLWTKITYTRSYAIPGHYILANTIPTLNQVGATEDVRVVFWFDC